MTVEAVATLTSHDVEEALLEGRLVPVCQPCFDLRTGRLVGVEALRSSELRQADAWVTALLEVTPNPVVVSDEDGSSRSVQVRTRSLRDARGDLVTLHTLHPELADWVPTQLRSRDP